MKDFAEFTSSLTREDIDYINTSDQSFSGDLANPDDMRDFIGFVGGLSFGRMLRLLELYHEWLQK
mgnify:CR=1 FL=1|jgi:hypothetical protein